MRKFRFTPTPESPPSKDGLQPGDIVTEVTNPTPSQTQRLGAAQALHALGKILGGPPYNLGEPTLVEYPAGDDIFDLNDLTEIPQ